MIAPPAVLPGPRGDANSGSLEGLTKQPLVRFLSLQMFVPMKLIEALSVGTVLTMAIFAIAMVMILAVEVIGPTIMLGVIWVLASVAVYRWNK